MNVWDIKLTVSEDDGHVLAAATLYTEQEIVRGSGQAFGIVADGETASPVAPAIKLAVARSLLDLVATLLQTAEADIHRVDRWAPVSPGQRRLQMNRR